MENKKLNQEKVKAVAELKEQFAGYSNFIFTDYRGIKMEQINELRKQLRAKKAVYKIVKNNYAKLAFKELQKPDVAFHLTGPTALALTNDDVGSAVAKILVDFGREAPVKMKGGLIGDVVFSKDQVTAYSALPGKNELLAMLMGTMKAPVQNLVCAMNGVASKLVRTLQAVADKKSQG